MTTAKFPILTLFLVLVTSQIIACSSSNRAGNEAMGERGGHYTETSSSHEDTVRLQQEIIRKQEEELKRQEREIEDLNRQKYYNRVPQPYGK